MVYSVQWGISHRGVREEGRESGEDNLPEYPSEPKRAHQVHQQVLMARS